MSHRNIIREIPKKQCIGDSLVTINSNFSELALGLDTLPSLYEGSGVTIDWFSSPQNKAPSLEFSYKTPATWKTKFDSFSSVTQLTSVLLGKDSLFYESYLFSHRPILQDIKPYGTFFDTVTIDDVYPKITVFWTASGNNDLPTAFPLNSAVSLNTSPIAPNGEVLCILRDENTVYIGGSFTKIGETEVRMLGTISLSSETITPTLENFPTFVDGSIKCLAQFEVAVPLPNSELTTNEKYLVLGGDFTTTSSGRGFVVYNQTLKYVKQTYYVNGSIEDISVDIDNNSLYAVGEFDWIVYGSNFASADSGERIICNNCVRFTLNKIEELEAIDLEFLAESASILRHSERLNAVAQHGNIVYLGGDLEIKEETGKTVLKNLLGLRREDDDENVKGTLVETCKFITNNSIHALFVDNEALYVGGKFSFFSSYDDFYESKNLNNFQEKDRFKYYNVAALSLTNSQVPTVNYNWKPKVNGPVYKFEVIDSRYDTEIYMLGTFTEINNTPYNYIGAVTKATSVLGNTINGIELPWNVCLNFKPSKNSRALTASYGSSLLVGGNFNRVNNSIRERLALISATRQHVSENFPTTIELECGGNVIDYNSEIGFDFDNVEKATQTARVNPQGIINKTTFSLLSETFSPLKKNQLCHFYIKRNGTNDTFTKNIYILGWNISYEKK